MPDSRVRFRDAAGTVRTGSWTVGTPGVDGWITAAGHAYDPETVVVLPPCEPIKIVCVGLNYADHAAERDATVPDRQSLFLKPPFAVASHGDTIPSGVPDRLRGRAGGRDR
jgi:2-keto-4-pentenoate hydratase/2-oxohepta-3-ene-1,7-dioic acid hydratase (catechol pathway)